MELLLFLGILIFYIWIGRHDKNDLYRLFKDTHQSNLDDIERQQLEEQAENNEEQETYLFDSAKLLHFYRKNTVNKS